MAFASEAGTMHAEKDSKTKDKDSLRIRREIQMHVTA